MTPPSAPIPSLLAGTRLAALDTETTGFDRAQGHVLIEVAWVELVDGRIGDTWSALVQAGRTIPPEATAVHGIKNAMLQDAPTAGEVAPELARRCEGLTLVFHNAAFDLPFLEDLLRKAGRPPLRNPIVDTLGLARGLFDPAGGNSLQELAARLKLAPGGAHRALEDALTTARLLQALAPSWEAEKGIHTIAELAAESQDVIRRTARRR